MIIASGLDALSAAVESGDDLAARVAAEATEYEIRPDIRARLWTLVLVGPGHEKVVAEAEVLLKTPSGTVEQYEEYRVICQDCERTRQDVAYFRTPEVQAWMRRALVLLCTSCGIEYMQGLNEILAPCLLVRPLLENMCIPLLEKNSTLAREFFFP